MLVITIEKGQGIDGNSDTHLVAEVRVMATVAESPFNSISRLGSYLRAQQLIAGPTVHSDPQRKCH
jgi:hypothetical protein